MQNDWQLDDMEHIAMAEFLQNEGIAIEDAGRYPLITYSSHYKQKLEVLEDPNEINALKVNGDHLRTAVLAARLGIPPHKWRHQLINLTDIFRSPIMMKGGMWANDWNGVWISKTHGGPGVCEIPLPVRHGTCATSTIRASTFYTLYAKEILNHSAFSYGVLCMCETACNKQPSGDDCTPFMVELQTQCERKVRLFGAYGSVWVPLYGPHAGKMLLAPEPFIYGRDKAHYLTGISSPKKNAYKDFISKEHEIDYCALLSDAYYEQASFSTEQVIPLTNSAVTVRARYWFSV